MSTGVQQHKQPDRTAASFAGAPTPSSSPVVKKPSSGVTAPKDTVGTVPVAGGVDLNVERTGVVVSKEKADEIAKEALERQDAATTIQAWFRGSRVRSTLQKSEEGEVVEEEEASSSDSEGAGTPAFSPGSSSSPVSSDVESDDGSDVASDGNGTPELSSDEESEEELQVQGGRDGDVSSSESESDAEVEVVEVTKDQEQVNSGTGAGSSSGLEEGEVKDKKTQEVTAAEKGAVDVDGSSVSSSDSDADSESEDEKPEESRGMVGGFLRGATNLAKVPFQLAQQGVNWLFGRKVQE